MRTFGLFCGALALSLCPSARADEMIKADRLSMVGDPQTQLTDFFQTLHLGNLREVQTSRLAETRAANPAVKDFAREMVRDHTQADQVLRQIAARKNVALSDAPPPFRSFAGLAAFQAEEKAFRQLGTLTGREFDTAYMIGQELAHLKALALAQAAPQVIADADVRQLCTQMGPELRRHLEAASRICKQLEQEPRGAGQAPAAGPPAPAAAAAAAAAAAGDQPQGVKEGHWTFSGNPQQALQEFVDKTHEFNQMEMKLVELGQQKSQNQQLKDFAARMLREHRDADQKLGEFARGKNLAFSEQQTKFDRLSDMAAEQMQMNCSQRLNNLSGVEFDKNFLMAEYGGHQWARAFLQVSAQYLPDQQGRDFAKGMLSAVEEHLQHIEQMGKQVHQAGGAGAPGGH